MSELAEALKELDEDKVNALVAEKIQAGVPATEIIADLNAGMVAVGDLYAAGTYFLSELIFSGEVLTNVMAKLEPILQGGAGGHNGTVIIGTVAGDIHDIGKNIVVSLLRGSGFEVIDLGVDVPAEKFVAKVKETDARIVGLCALLNFTYPEMKNVIEALAAGGVRAGTAVIIGGAPCNEQVREFAGADFYAPDAVAAVAICKNVYQS